MSSNRQNRAQIAIQTNEILHRKEYLFTSYSSFNDVVMGEKVDEIVSIAPDLESSCAGTLVLDEKTTNLWKNNYINMKHNRKNVKYPNIRVVNMTTFAAAREIYHNQKERIKGALSNDVDERTKVLCLNFASAKHAGGGFLKGSQAQEESLARASGLYSCLLQAPAYYKANRSTKRPGMYEDLIIYSPGVPVFRDDNDALIRAPWKTAIITAPAPNRGALIRHTNTDTADAMESSIRENFEKRIDMILTTAAHFSHKNLVLGAWGCGVFKNDPKVVASLFKKALLKKCFEGAFDSVVFAVLDRTQGCQTFNAFHDTFICNEEDLVTKFDGSLSITS